MNLKNTLRFAKDEIIQIGIVLMLFLLPLLSTAQTTPPPGAVVISPNSDIAAAMIGKPAGTTYFIELGEYRMQQLTPRANDKFIGQVGANNARPILNGSRKLNSWKYDGKFWYHGGQDQPLDTTYNHGCVTGNKGCMYEVELYRNDKFLTKKLSKAEVIAPNQWYFDYGTNTVYLYDDPSTTTDNPSTSGADVSGKKLEISVSKWAFAGPNNNVTIKNLIVEKYAVQGHAGAIGYKNAGIDWIIENNEVRLNHGQGISFKGTANVVNNYAHHNGQMGIGGTRITGGVVKDNVITYNTVPEVGFSWSHEGGGTKFSLSDGLNILNNTVSNNYGPGLWTDIQNINTLYEGNTCIDNLASGIFHEISYKATIRCNTVKGNANKHGAQIFISTSSDVEVYNNVVAISEAHPGDGIVVQQGDRTADESNGVIYRAKNNYVHHNDISYSSQAKLSGVRESYNPNNDFWATSNNAFNNNTYHVPAVSDPNTQKLWTWNNTSLNWSGMRTAGQEKQGVVNNIFPTTILLTVNAGPDKTIALPVSNVTLAGSVSSTYEIASYLWTKVSGPSSGVMSGANTATLSLTSLTAGTYVFRFTAATECNSSVSDDVKVIVEPATSVLYRGINLNGPALPIDGENWEGSATATNFSFTGRPFENQTINLIPATTANKSSMIRSSYWRASGTDSVTVTLSAVPVGTYEVFLYTWEDNTSTTFDIYLEGVKVIQDYSSGVAGTWKKHSLGQAFVSDGNIKVKAKRGDACVSGIEVRKVLPYRAINLNGGALVIDGNNYEASSTAANFSFTGRVFANQAIALNPATDASRTSMIRSSFWRTSDSDSVTATLSAVSPGTYKVFLYTWEDNNSTTFDIYLEGVKKVSAFASGTAGMWKKHDLGTVIVNDGNIKIKAKGGDACISGIEVWKVSSNTTAREFYASKTEFDEESESKINVYPVPFKNHVTIELNESEINAGAVQYAIVDITGKTQRGENYVLQEGQSLLEVNNLEDLHTGLYILRVRTGHTVRAVKIIKE